MSMWKRINELTAQIQNRPGSFSHERLSPRFDTKLLVSFAGESASRETCGNVGIGGFCFESNRSPEPGEALDLLVDLTGMGHWVFVRGVVLGMIELKKGRVGIRGRFTSIAFEDERRLARWIDNQALAAA
jgi:hypothetical protein